MTDNTGNTFDVHDYNAFAAIIIVAISFDLDHISIAACCFQIVGNTIRIPVGVIVCVCIFSPGNSITWYNYPICSRITGSSNVCTIDSGVGRNRFQTQRHIFRKVRRRTSTTGSIATTGSIVTAGSITSTTFGAACITAFATAARIATLDRVFQTCCFEIVCSGEY